MDDKPFYESKTVWGSIFVALGTIYGAVTEDVVNAQIIVGVGLGLLGIGVRGVLGKMAI